MNQGHTNMRIQLFLHVLFIDMSTRKGKLKQKALHALLKLQKLALVLTF